MDSFGEFLRRERELRHIELNEISKITKIKKAYLQAIENDAYEELPDIAFVKGFIRAYCNYIGLDPEQTVNYFQQFYDESFRQTGQPQKTGIIQGMNRRTLAFAALGIVAAGILAAGIYSVSKGGSSHRSERYRHNIQELSITSTVTAPPIPAEATAITQTALSITTTTGNPLTMTVRQHTLLLKATENTWVKLIPNNEENAGQEALLKPGDRVAWKFSGTALLIIGNAEGLNVQLDNKEIHHNHVRAEVIRLKLAE